MSNQGPVDLNTPPANAPVASPTDATVQDLPDPTLLTRVILSHRDRQLLDKGTKLLVGIQSPIFEIHCRRVHYTAEEHAMGWSLLGQASGRDTPLECYFYRQQSTQPLSARDMTRLGDIDAFENDWFPRTRVIIQRAIPKAERDAFEAAFFLDMEQQPLGPSVVRSVRLFIERVVALETSAQPHAKALRETLAKRGLTAQEIDRMRAMLDDAEQGLSMKKADKDAPRRVLAAREAQLDGVDKFRGWYNEWATAFRQVITNANHLVVLGLTTFTREVAEPEEPEAPPAPEAPAKEPVAASKGATGAKPVIGPEDDSPFVRP
ncbi:MAG: hypothetical protein U0271_26055 [Polyangiaceae bacterium]